MADDLAETCEDKSLPCPSRESSGVLSQTMTMVGPMSVRVFSDRSPSQGDCRNGICAPKFAATQEFDRAFWTCRLIWTDRKMANWRYAAIPLQISLRGDFCFLDAILSQK
jgi:hypothetical protein